MNQTINIGTEINLVDLLQSRLLIQGNSGSGKSTVARSILEEVFGKVPFVVLDIEGEYYTLKEKHGDIIVIGGQYADVPINIEMAEMLPQFIVSNRLSVILDLSDFKMDERVRFTKAFLEELMDLPQKYWISYLFFIEEAHKLCGEQDKQISASAVKDLMTRGRKRGYCGCLLTQRISKLHKDAAAECNNKFIGRTTLDLDMDRSGKELGFRSAKDNLKLRDLKPGHFYAYGTSIEPQHVHEVTIKFPETKMPKAGSSLEIKPRKANESTLAALKKLSDQVAATPAEDKKQINDALDQNTIWYYEGKINQLMDEHSKEFNRAHELEMLKNDWAKLAVERGVRLKKISDFIRELENEEMGKTILINDQEYESALKHELSKPNYEDQLTKIASSLNPGETFPPAGLSKQFNGGHNSKLPPGELSILTACAMHVSGLSRQQLTTICGYKRSSRDQYILRLKQKMLITDEQNKITATKDGFKILGPNFKKLPVGIELQKYWLNVLPTGEKNILERLIKNFPNAITKDWISEITGYKRSSRDQYILRMAAKEIIEVTGNKVKASTLLFNVIP